MILRLDLCSFPKISLRQLNYDNYIVITVTRNNNDGWNQIFSGEARDDILPDKIKINNDNEITSNIQRVYSLPSQLH